MNDQNDIIHHNHQAKENNMVIYKIFSIRKLYAYGETREVYPLSYVFFESKIDFQSKQNGVNESLLKSQNVPLSSSCNDNVCRHCSLIGQGKHGVPRIPGSKTMPERLEPFPMMIYAIS